jgi:DNA-binding response OmpR family regulator
MWEEAREAGAIAYFEKPFDMMDLMLSAKYHIHGEEYCISRPQDECHDECVLV